jgi:stage V sporulation protein G
MEITEIKIYPVNEDGPLKAYVSIVLDSVFAVHDLKVIQGTSKLFVAMPNKKDKSGNWRDVVHPINQEARTKIETEILSRYHSVLEEQASAPPADAEQE